MRRRQKQGLNRRLTPGQKRVLALMTDEWQCQDDLQCRNQPLKFLEQYGLIEVKRLKDHEKWPMTNILYRRKQ